MTATGADTVVLDLRDVRSAWDVPEWVADRVREALPDHWTVVVVDDPRDGTGDGGTGVSKAALSAVADARVYMGLGIPAAVVRAGSRLEWTHTITAGVGGSLSPEMRGSDIVLTNSAGIHGVPMAETVLGLLLHFARGLDFAVEGMARGAWMQEPFTGAGSPVRELGESVVGILGYGGIGREVARRASAMGSRVLALRRTPPESGDPWAEVLHGPGGLERIVGRSDYLVVTLPETDATTGLLNRERLRRMKKGAVLVNVARAGIVDGDALIELLESGHLRGAALDAFSPEPLPDDHPFWTTPNLFLTPHVSAVTDRFWERQADLIIENIGRFLEGAPLLNRVDKSAGY